MKKVDDEKKKVAIEIESPENFPITKNKNDECMIIAESQLFLESTDRRCDLGNE